MGAPLRLKTIFGNTFQNQSPLFQDARPTPIASWHDPRTNPWVILLSEPNWSRHASLYKTRPEGRILSLIGDLDGNMSLVPWTWTDPFYRPKGSLVRWEDDDWSPWRNPDFRGLSRFPEYVERQISSLVKDAGAEVKYDEDKFQVRARNSWLCRGMLSKQTKAYFYKEDENLVSKDIIILCPTSR